MKADNQVPELGEYYNLVISLPPGGFVPPIGENGLPQANNLHLEDSYIYQLVRDHFNRFFTPIQAPKPIPNPAQKPSAQKPSTQKPSTGDTKELKPFSPEWYQQRWARINLN